jgi:hypothetical protein
MVRSHRKHELEPAKQFNNFWKAMDKLMGKIVSSRSELDVDKKNKIKWNNLPIGNRESTGADKKAEEDLIKQLQATFQNPFLRDC